MAQDELQTWEIRYLAAGARGMEIARARVDPVDGSAWRWSVEVSNRR
jgi:hypothetical protein